MGSDHFDLAAAAEHSITVAEITGSNVVSVAEHVVMQILALVRNYIPAYQEVVDGGWDIGKVAAPSHDLEDKRVGHRRVWPHRTAGGGQAQALRRADALL